MKDTYYNEMLSAQMQLNVSSRENSKLKATIEVMEGDIQKLRSELRKRVEEIIELRLTDDDCQR